ncbi:MULTISPECIES: type VI secretion system ATPase TssH [unclassified Caballeronia]|uniref:type VI secretion system ATPase TssH n=1 Tax=unclassified Caballeronia TaxID=2646786 RepID=UPI002863F14C|nr:MULTISPECIES: type VI secretion system ATPase TssH [unclassified Caballeronia]MDR5773594.1 type VI secretion system ATPase TssH [Caballeronia sp. LZ002]MDR5849028.1 type VI secretion system ATPase TssH [Caballeronia sp. LZ003]
MLLVDLKPLVSRLNGYCRQALENSAGLCISRGQYEISVEHMLVKLLDDPQSDIPLLLREQNIDAALFRRALDQSIEDLRGGNTGRPVFSPVLLELLQDAWLIASVDLLETRVRSGAILLAFLARATFYATGGYADMLRPINRESLLARFGAASAASIEQTAAGTSSASEGGASAAAGSDGSAIAKYCENFTEKAREGKIDPVFGRDAEIRQMVDILARRRKNNPICVGDPGVGKTAVVEGLALRIVDGDVPESLRDVTILGLDMGMLQAGASVKGEFENRLKGIINEIKASVKPVILFIDEAHTLIGAGGQAGTSDAANLFKPALARGELRTIAATTWAEYKKYFEKDAALARRFQLVKLDEPDLPTAVLILRGLKERYEDVHKVVMRDDAIVAAAELSSRYITGRQLPDKAVDLLDTACARVKVLQSAKPDVLEDTERRIQALERERRGLERDRDNMQPVDDERLAAIADALPSLEARAADLRVRWLAQKEAGEALVAARGAVAAARAAAQPEAQIDALRDAAKRAEADLREAQGDQPMVRVDVDPDVVAKVVSDWTGIPLGKVQRDQAQTILNMETTLARRVRGQDHAMHQIAEVLKSSAAGLKDPEQPMGVFLLAGPSGVGKTETALTVADILFGDEKSTVTVNMSEFQERHNVSRLIGSPPGYVGYGEGGLLTEAVRQRPYSVVLLDETEKAHLDVMNLFYQVFDKGMLSDGEGKEIDFSNTVVFLTSNLATDVITELTANGERPDDETILAAVRPILSAHFKPALLARMTVIPYYTLPTDALAGIVRLKLDKIVKRLLGANKIRLAYTDEVVDTIAARCTEVETGARNIDFILRGTVMPMLSHEILIRMSEAEQPTHAELDVNDEGVFVVSFGFEPAEAKAAVIEEEAQ